MNKIDQFENLAERLVEGTFTRLFAGRISPAKVAHHLEQAIHDHTLCVPGRGAQVPTEYHVYLNPQDYEAVTPGHGPKADPTQLEHELAEHIEDLMAESPLTLASPAAVHVAPDEDVALHDVRVEARWAEASLAVERTREMKAARAEETGAPSEGPEGRPFLIIDGERHVTLNEPTISIGRALDNDIIIEDPRISRHHAQIRQRYGHMVLYDLDSSGGSTINGYPVEECVLHSGDVISLAGVDLIYGEDPPTPIPLPSDEDTPALVAEDWEEDEEVAPPGG